MKKRIEVAIDDLTMEAFDAGWNAVVEIIHKMHKKHIMAEDEIGAQAIKRILDELWESQDENE